MIVATILMLISIMLGVSYAGFRWNFVGNLIQQLKTDDVKIEFLSSDENVVYLSNALPMSDD